MRVPDYDLTVAGHHHRTHPLLRTGRGLLLDFTATDDLALRLLPWADRVDHVRAAASIPGDTDVPEALLVRPDGYVCWAGQPGIQPSTLTESLTSWFGPRQLASRHDTASVRNFPAY
jgi:hypothetical protein